ncbi:hypothetical protein KPH14_001533 [Odynerus spinipes]|uniref:Condensin-2 complex subunit H2 C-terminal domain-containing protein n=1 Tax=Odynerus spinipes TaxID=1348599 RepID=A0AAD9VTB3_9HYME|nr:hypothetical protein KPH14_001533 [Odynerus spinipes]
MVNLQDITCQLMKPTKDLANWKFPLSEILKEYYALLEAHCDVNFGEAALILQNSVNIYVRRVERLFDEAKCLTEMFVDHEVTNENDNSKCDKKNRNKNSINFDDFKLCNLVEEVGKNINTKNRFNVEKPVKLLTRRFAQLENNTEDIVHKKVEIIDIHGDVIGKKYHFRCNQYLNMNGLLIDEPTQDDFGTVDMESSATSGYCSNTSVFDSSCNLESNVNSMCNTLSDNNVESLTNCCLSPIPSNIDCSIDMEDFNVSNNDTINEERGQIKHIDVKEKSINFQNNSKINEQLITTHDTNMNNMDNLQNQENCTNYLFNRRPEEIKHPINTKKTMNSRIWEPVPLTHNISINRKRTVNLLNHTSSIISKTETRKRKIISKLHKNECTVSFLLKESKLQQKSSACASKKQTFSQFKAEEINELQKTFEDCFKTTEVSNSFQCQTSTNTIDDSQDKNAAKNNTIRNDTFLDESDVLPVSPSFLDCETRSLSPIDTIFSTLNDTSLQLDSQHSLPNYERLIEHEMKKLFEDSDVQTELERKVNKWHQLMQPKLAKIEKKPIFRIHEYVSRITRKLRNNNHQRVTFNNIVDGECSYEVARYFLALLQLANTYKVDISAKENIDECIEILLLNTDVPVLLDIIIITTTTPPTSISCINNMIYNIRL